MLRNNKTFCDYAENDDLVLMHKDDVAYLRLRCRELQRRNLDLSQENDRLRKNILWLSIVMGSVIAVLVYNLQCAVSLF